ncbi:MAG TPA: hypothetical protein PKN59_06545, partial [Syntrophales bacterium]|nr:hypothetical protein [Syntrophales bacterium]
ELKNVRITGPLALTKSKGGLLYGQFLTAGDRRAHVQVQEESDPDHRTVPGHGLRMVAEK